MLRFITSLIIVFLLAEGSFQNIYGAISAIQRNALIALYNNTGGANWTNNSNWGGVSGTENT
jgi:hypothetical protein